MNVNVFAFIYTELKSCFWDYSMSYNSYFDIVTVTVTFAPFFPHRISYCLVIISDF